MAYHASVMDDHNMIETVSYMQNYWQCDEVEFISVIDLRTVASESHAVV